MGHIHELYDFTTSAFIVNEGRILLQHHVKIGKWLQPGGHIELDEDPIQALYREIKEESGLTKENLEIIETAKDTRQQSKSGNNRVLPLPFDMNVHPFNETHQHIDICYLMRSNTETVRPEEGKAHDIGWFTLEGIAAMRDDGLVFQDTYDLAKFALKYTA